MRSPLVVPIIVALLLVSGLHAEPEITVETPGSPARYRLTLPEAMPEGKDITIHLGVQDGEFLQAWGEIPGNRPVVDVFDASGLKLQGNNKLTGQAKIWVKLDKYRHTYVCLIDLDARIDGGKIEGSYDARYSVLTDTLIYATDDLAVKPGEFSLFHYGQEVKGKVTCAMQEAAGKEEAEMVLWSRHLLEGHASWQRYVTMKAVVKNGKVTKLQVAPTNERSGWNAEKLEQDLTFDGKKLSGQVTFETKGNGGGTFAGTYRLTIDAQVEHNIVKGTVKATRNGKNYGQDSRLSGVADSGQADSRASAVFALNMPKAVEGIRDLRVHIDRKDGKIAAAKAFVPEYPEWYDVKLANTRGGGGFFAGKLTVQFPANTYMTTKVQAIDVTYTLDMKGSPTESKGTYRCEFGQYTRTSGKLTGSVVDLDSLLRRDAIRKGYDWPCWNGPTSSFTATPSGRSLVDRLDEARLVWISEHTPPARCQTTRYGEGNLERYIQRGGPGGGGCSPVVADGRVFLSYFQPVEGDTLSDYVKEQTEKGKHVAPIMFAANGEDVLLCVDAATGRTLWRVTVPGGRYWAMNGRQGSSKGWYTTSPAAADGKVVFGTSSDQDCCLDVKTGKVLWSRRLGPTSGRVIIGGVLVRAGRDLVGYDLETGKAKWTVKDAGATYALPARFKSDGKEYIIVANEGGEMRCVDPEDGSVLWIEKKVGYNSLSISVSGNHVFCNGSKGKRGGSLAIYRIDRKGATRINTDLGYSPKAAPAAACGSHAYIRLKKPDGLAVTDLKGKTVARSKCNLGAAGYVQVIDDRVMVQEDASHSRTPLLWYDVSSPAKTRQLGDVWPTRHRTTTSYYPVLISHAIADGRIFIRGQRGIVCYDLRANESD